MSTFENPAASTVNTMRHDGDAMRHIPPKDLE